MVMKDQNKIDEKNSNTDTIQIKVIRYINKHESIMSKLLYLVSIGWFLFETIILSLVAVYNNLLNIVSLIYLIVFGVIIISIPILHYLRIIKELSSSEIKSFEMLGSLIFFIASIVVNYIPEFTIIILSTLYPGKYVIGVITILFFIIMSAIFIIKLSTRDKSS